MEIEASLSCSQEPAIGSCHTPYFFKTRFSEVLQLRWGLSSDFLPWGFPSNTVCISHLSNHSTRSAHLIGGFVTLITFGGEYKL
jgi:hypothetical protein